jgi:hypothetical protein
MATAIAGAMPLDERVKTRSRDDGDIDLDLLSSDERGDLRRLMAKAGVHGR